SRGARFVYFVDQSRKACRIIRENLESLDIEDGFQVLEMDLIRGFDVIDTPIDIAYVDPPYESENLYQQTLQRFQGGLLIVEHSKRKELPEVAGRLQKIRSLVQGDAALAFY